MENSYLKFKRDIELEQEACNNILLLFTDQWVETSKEAPRAVVQKILAFMLGACVTDNSEVETEESCQIRHFNVFVGNTIELLKSDAPLPYSFTGVDLDSTLVNIKKIEEQATLTNEPYLEDIIGRMEIFMASIEKAVAEYGKNRGNNFFLSLLVGTVGGFALGWICCHPSETDLKYGFDLWSNETFYFIWGLSTLVITISMWKALGGKKIL